MLSGNKIGSPRPKKSRRVTSNQKTPPIILFDDIDPGVCGKVIPYSRNWEFTTTDVGFVDLAEHAYQLLATNSPEFAKDITQAMFFYYCSVILQARKLAISTAHGKSHCTNKRAETIGRNAVLPEPLHRYLQCMGDFKLINGDAYKWHDPVPYAVTHPAEDVDGQNYPLFGSFGQIKPESEPWYASRFLPAVQIYLCGYEYRQTCNEKLGLNPPLPEEWRPENAAPFEKPTRNLLGWRPLKGQLNGQAVKFYEIHGFRQHTNGLISHPNLDPDQLCYCQLFEGIANAVRLCGEVANLVEGVPADSVGCVVQAAWVEMTNESVDSFGCGAGSIFSTQNMESAKAAFLLMFRQQRSLIEGDVQPMLAWNFEESDIPREYIEHRNDVFRWGTGAEYLMQRRYRGSGDDRIAGLSAWVRNCLKRPEV